MLRKLRKNYRRLVAFMLTVAMTFANVAANLNVAFAAGEEQEALFLVDGEDLREAIQDAMDHGGTFRFSSLELKAKKKSLKTSYEKLIGGKDGAVYQLDVEVDDSYAPEGTSVEVFYNAGTDDVIFLFINESDMVVSFRANVDGYETGRVTINPNAANVDDTEASYVEDYSSTTMIDDMPHTAGAEVLNPTTGADADEGTQADPTGEDQETEAEPAVPTEGTGTEASTGAADGTEAEENTDAADGTGAEESTSAPESTGAPEVNESQETGESTEETTAEENNGAQDGEAVESVEENADTESLTEAQEPQEEEPETPAQEEAEDVQEAQPEAAAGTESVAMGISVRKLSQVASSVEVLEDADVVTEPEEVSQDEEPETTEEVREEETEAETETEPAQESGTGGQAEPDDSTDDDQTGNTPDSETSNGADDETVDAANPGTSDGADSGTGNGTSDGADSGTGNGTSDGTDSGTGNETSDGADSGTSDETGDAAAPGTSDGTGSESGDAAGNGTEPVTPSEETTAAPDTGIQDSTEDTGNSAGNESRPEESQPEPTAPAETPGDTGSTEELPSGDISQEDPDEIQMDGQLLEDDDIEILGELEGKAYDTVTILDSANARAWKTAFSRIEEIIIPGEADYAVEYHVNNPDAAIVKGADHVAGGQDLYFAVELKPGFEISAVYANGTELEAADDPAELASGSDWTGYAHVYLAAGVEEDLWIDIETEELDKTIPAADYTGETEDALFTVSVPDGAFEEEVSLQVSRIDDPDRVEELKVQANGLVKDGQTIADILVYDVSFISRETGEEVEPARPVRVRARMKTPVVSQETTEQQLRITEISVVHLPEDKAAEVVASTENAEATEFKFQADSFSEFLFLAMTDAELANGVAKIVTEDGGESKTTYYATLQEAVNAVGGTGDNAQPQGAEIVLMADVKENITSSNKDYTLNMDGYKLTSGEMGKSIYVVKGGTVTIKNGTIYGAYKNPDRSGSIHGIENSGAELTLVNCRITDNEQRGIYASKGSLTLENCIVSNNGSNGIEASGCNVTITGKGEFKNNVDGYSGSAIYVSNASLTMDGKGSIIDVSSNVPKSSSSGAIYVRNGEVSIKDVLLTHNTSGAIVVSNTSQNVALENVEIAYQAEGKNDSSLYVTTTTGTMTADNCKIHDNTVIGSRNGSVSYMDFIVSLYGNGKKTFNNCQFYNNAGNTQSGYQTKGVVFVRQGEAEFNDCSFTGNKDFTYTGGVIYAGNNSSYVSTVHLNGGIISGNSTKNGAVYVKGYTSTKPSTVYVKNTVIRDNTASNTSGGGVYLGSNGKFVMDSGAVYNNTPHDLYSESSVSGAFTVPEASEMVDSELDETYFQERQYAWKYGNTTVKASELNWQSRRGFVATQSLMGAAQNKRTGETYATLNAAVDAAASGDTISLVNPGTIEANKINCDAQIYVQNGKSVTIELNGFTVEATGTAANYSTNNNGLLRVGTRASVTLTGDGKLCNKVFVGSNSTLNLNGNIDIQTMHYNDKSDAGSPLILYGTANVNSSMDSLKVYMGGGNFHVAEGTSVGMLRLEANVPFTDQAYPKTVTIDGTIGTMELTQQCSKNVRYDSFSAITINGNVGTLTAVQDGMRYSKGSTNTLTINGSVDDMTLTQGSTSSGAACYGRTVTINGPVGSLHATQAASANVSVSLLELNSEIGSLTLKHLGSSSKYYPLTRAGEGFFADSMTLIPAIPSREGVTKEDLVNQAVDAERNDIMMLRLPEGYGRAQELAEASEWRAPELNNKPITLVDGIDYNYLTSVAVGQDGNIVLTKSSGVFVYLDPANGVDSNTGMAAGQPVQTLEEALQVLAKAQAEGLLKEPVIYLKSGLEITGDQTLDQEGVILQRYPAYKGALLKVKSGTLTLKKITLDGSSTKDAKAEAPLVVVNKGAALRVEDGAVVQNNTNTYTNIASNGSGAKYEGGGIWNAGTMTMDGGTIQGNSAACGSGVFTQGAFEMTGGTITGNHGAGKFKENTIPSSVNNAGGGVFIGYSSGRMDMSGGTISGNTADMGGGISVGNGDAGWFRGASLSMTGGTIEGNTATNTSAYQNSYAGGGGIYIQAGCKAVISGGSIVGNTCMGNLFGGGGIYVNGDDAFEKKNNIPAGRLELTNVLISENDGGAGVAVCEDGDMKVYLTDGGIIHGNTSGSRSWDLYAASYDNSHGGLGGGAQKKGELYVSRYMLGGGAYLWKDLETGELVSSGDLRSHFKGLKVYSSATQITGEDDIQVRITGNHSATTGSGVGGNGDVIIGKDTTSDDRMSITVKKQWNVPLEDVSRITVTYDLWSKPTEAVAADEIPSKENGWVLEDSAERSIAFEGGLLSKPYWPDAVFTQLPKTELDSGKELTYRVTERVDADGRFLCEGVVEDSEHDNTFIITNRVVCSLRLTKKVVDMYETESAGDTGFRFTVTLKDPEGRPYTDASGVTDQDGQPVVFDENGTVAVELKAGETVDFHGLTKGTTYTIEEEKNDDYNTGIEMSWGTGTSAVSQKINGTVASNKIETIGITAVTYTNETKEPHGSLTIEKTVKGATGDTGKQWNFRVKLMNANGDPLAEIGKVFKFTYVKHLGTGEETGEVRVDDDGMAVFYQAGSSRGSSSMGLAHGQSVTIDGLPEGAGYLVTEDEANTGDYVTTVTGDQGTIVKKQNHKVTFTNTETGGLMIHKTVEGEAGDREKAWEFTLNLDLTDQDGSSLLAGTEDPETMITYKKYAGAPDTAEGTVLEEGNIPVNTEKDQAEFTFTLKHGEYLTIHNLPTGTRYQVLEKEANTGGYLTTVSQDGGTISRDGEAEVHFTNRLELTEVEGVKVWEDAANQDGKRPQSIRVNLLADGQPVASQTVTAPGEGTSDRWSWKFSGLPRYKDGNEIVYTVTEDVVADYSTGYSRAEDGSFIITNQYTPGVTSYRVEKRWADSDNKDKLRPESITVQLMQNGTAMGPAVVLNQAGNWTYEWKNLPQKLNGKDVEYKVAEIQVTDGYTVSYVYSGNVAVITNTHTPVTPPPTPGKPNRPGGNGGGGGGGGSSDGGNPPTVPIDPGQVPLAKLDDQDILNIIEDEDVPLAALPKTGHSSSAALMFMLSGMMMAAFAAVTGKKEEE